MRLVFGLIMRSGVVRFFGGLKLELLVLMKVCMFLFLLMCVR